MAFTHTSPKKDEGVVATAATPLLFSVLRRVSAWSGLIPFFLFLILFLFIPAISVFSQALHDADGSFGFSAMREAISGQNLDALNHDTLVHQSAGVGVGGAGAAVHGNGAVHGEIAQPPIEAGAKGN